MLNCAVPGCHVREKYLRSGSLHLLDVLVGEEVTTNIVWFCHECTSKYTVQTWRSPGEQIRRRMQVSSRSVVRSYPDKVVSASALGPPPEAMPPVAAERIGEMALASREE